jgi:hypothetical protein
MMRWVKGLGVFAENVRRPNPGTGSQINVSLQAVTAEARKRGFSKNCRSIGGAAIYADRSVGVDPKIALSQVLVCRIALRVAENPTTPILITVLGKNVAGNTSFVVVGI